MPPLPPSIPPLSERLGTTQTKPLAERLGGAVKPLAERLYSLSDAVRGITRYEKAEEPAKPVNKVDAPSVLKAISHNESRGVDGDPYSFSQPSGSKAAGQAIGKYQVTEGELKSWSKEFLGRVVSPKEFGNTPAVQDAYMSARVNALAAAGATMDEIFALHRGGLTGYASSTVRAKKLKERKGYVDSAMEFLQSTASTTEAK